MHRLGFASGHTLAANAGARGVDSYDVDFTATTGKSTRWSTQFGAPPAYADRREADKKLLVYDAAPVERDMELAGYPIVD
ncbi:hydrolase, partial [Pseudomonas sp. GW456-11-11-14-LB1]